MFKEFKEFAMRGNVIDLAIGVIIGASFGKIVTSLVDDIIMPPIGLVLGGVDFPNLFITLKGEHYATLVEAKRHPGVVTLNYGLFLNTVINFLIVAFCVFLLVQQVNRWTRTPEAVVAATTKECPQCAMSIPINARKCPHCTSPLA